MRRFLLLSALFLLLATGAGHALAKAQYANCTGFCFAWTAWNGTIYGVAGNFEPTGAGMHFNTNTGTLERFMAVWGGPNGAGYKSNIHVGAEVDMPGNGLCGTRHNYEAAYWIVFSTNTSGGYDTSSCWDMPGGDADNPNSFQINPYVSNGGGMRHLAV